MRYAPDRTSLSVVIFTIVIELQHSRSVDPRPHAAVTLAFRYTHSVGRSVQDAESKRQNGDGGKLKGNTKPATPRRDGVFKQLDLQESACQPQYKTDTETKKQWTKQHIKKSKNII